MRAERLQVGSGMHTGSVLPFSVTLPSLLFMPLLALLCFVWKLETIQLTAVSDVQAWLVFFFIILYCCLMT